MNGARSGAQVQRGAFEGERGRQGDDPSLLEADEPRNCVADESI